MATYEDLLTEQRRLHQFEQEYVNCCNDIKHQKEIVNQAIHTTYPIRTMLDSLEEDAKQIEPYVNPEALSNVLEQLRKIKHEEEILETNKTAAVTRVSASLTEERRLHERYAELRDEIHGKLHELRNNLQETTELEIKLNDATHSHTQAEVKLASLEKQLINKLKEKQEADRLYQKELSRRQRLAEELEAAKAELTKYENEIRDLQKQPRDTPSRRTQVRRVYSPRTDPVLTKRKSSPSPLRQRIGTPLRLNKRSVPAQQPASYQWMLPYLALFATSCLLFFLIFK